MRIRISAVPRYVMNDIIDTIRKSPTGLRTCIISFLDPEPVTSNQNNWGLNNESLNVKGLPDIVDVLEISVYDLDEPLENYNEIFENKHAKQVVDFVNKNKDKMDYLLVHCTAGISRSMGCAAAISKYLYDTDEVFFKKGRPNMRIYRMILEEFNK